MNSKITVMSTGFADLSAAAYLATAGYQVTADTKYGTVGSKARQLNTKGYVFDIAPSQYCMPHMIEEFFNNFGYSTADFYEQEQLRPGFTMVVGDNDTLNIPAETSDKYHTRMDKMVYKPGLSVYTNLFLPFLIVNGLLTGIGLKAPIVWYNNTENIQVRILTISVEDVFYGMSLILFNLLLVST